MELIGFEKVKDGKYLKNYELTYRNKQGREKKYEIVSRRDLSSTEELGQRSSGVSIVAFHEGKMLLLREFRMGVNKTIYNLCAGMQEKGETVEECIARELYEETGLSVKRVLKILPASFAAVAISDTRTQIAFVEAEGIPTGEHTSENEEITADFYTRDEVLALIDDGAPFSSRAQIAAFFFAQFGTI